MIKSAVGKRILKIQCTCRMIFVRLKSNARKTVEHGNATMPGNSRMPQSTTWKIPKILASNVTRRNRVHGRRARVIRRENMYSGEGHRRFSGWD